MTFSSSLPALLAAIIATGVGAFIVAALMDTEYEHVEFGGYREYEEYIFRGTPADERVYFLTHLAILYIIVNALVFPLSATMVDDPYRSATLPEATAHFGLEAGKEYPLQIGDRIARTSGDASTHDRLFYASASALAPSSGVSLGFENSSGKSWIFKIPTSQITFEKTATNDAESKIVVHLDEEAHAPYSDFKVQREHTDCRLKVSWGWWLCDRSVTSESLVVSDEAERRGLAAIVDNPNTSVVITLTPEMYEQLLHGGQ